MKDLYDPKSVRNLKNNSYPSESDLKKELSEFITILKKYNVTVYRPKDISDINQIFVRDVGFVIDNFFFKSNIIPKRDKEYEGIKNIIKSFDSELIELPIDIHIEGGDVINFNNYLSITDEINIIYNLYTKTFLYKTQLKIFSPFLLSLIHI